MMTSKDLLLKQKEIAQWWAPIAHDDRFDQLYLIMGVDIRNNSKSIEEVNAAMTILESLKTIADNPPEQTKNPSSGLRHE